MSLTLIEVSPTAVNRQPGAATGDGFVYEHLRYYCSKFEPLPAITIRLKNLKAEVVSGGEYLEIARDLGRPAIRAIVLGTYSEADLSQFIQQGGGRLLDWEQIDRADQTEPIVSAWHVFFFDRALQAVERAEFERSVAGFFMQLAQQRRDQSGIVGNVSFDAKKARAEFEAITPVGDESWYSAFFAVCRRFSTSFVRIVSYQGRRF